MNATVIAETVRRHLTSAGYIAFLLFIAMVALFVSNFAIPGTLWPPLVSLLAIVTGSAIVGPEFSTGTLQLIVSKPIRRSVYLVSRVAGVFACVALAAALAVTVECSARLLFGRAPVPWQRLGEVFAGELFVGLESCIELAASTVILAQDFPCRSELRIAPHDAFHEGDFEVQVPLFLAGQLSS